MDSSHLSQKGANGLQKSLGILLRKVVTGMLDEHIVRGGDLLIEDMVASKYLGVIQCATHKWIPFRVAVGISPSPFPKVTEQSEPGGVNCTTRKSSFRR